MIIDKLPLGKVEFNYKGFLESFGVNKDIEKSIMNNLRILQDDLDDGLLLKRVYWGVDWNNFFKVNNKGDLDLVNFTVFKYSIEGFKVYRPGVINVKEGSFEFKEEYVNQDSFIVFDDSNKEFNPQIEYTLGSDLVDWVNNKWNKLFDLT